MTRTRRWIAAVLALAAGAVVVVAFTGDPRASGAAPGPAAATSVWSARRVPQPIVAAVGAQHLQQKMDAEVGDPGACFMVESDGAVVASSNVDAPLVPASAEKLFTAAASLQVLGPDFTYDTKVVASAAPIDGAVDQLVLVGSGDPVLSTEEYAASVAAGPVRKRGGVITSLDDLAQAVVDAGVRRVKTGVVADDSRYDQQRQVDGWASSYLADGDVGLLGALSVDDGNQTVTPRRVANDPALNAATKLTALLTARGVQVGAPSRGAAPSGAVEIAKATSPPLRDIVGSMLSTSDATTAELLAKELGVRAGQGGTTAAGTAAILASLQKLGVKTDGLTLVDASGLHRGDRATCSALLATMNLGAQPRYDTLWNGLSVVGEHGTLVDQLLGLGLEGKLRAKTGFLNGVTAMVGKLDDDQHVQFAYVDNGDFPQSVAEGLRRTAASVLSTFPEAPEADKLVPAPT